MLRANRFFAVVLVCLVFWSPAAAGQVSLEWDPNATPPDGYLIFKRLEGSSYNYSVPAWQGTQTTCTLNGLADGKTYFFVARAYVGANQSGDSNEVSYTVPGVVPGKISTIYLSQENDMPFLNTDFVPKDDVAYFEVDIDGTIHKSDPQISGDTCRLHIDVSDVPLGEHRVIIRGVNIWGAGEASDPFVFTKALPSKPSGITLSAE
jgi:hypothetical protein